MTSAHHQPDPPVVAVFAASGTTNTSRWTGIRLFTAGCSLLLCIFTIGAFSQPRHRLSKKAYAVVLNFQNRVDSLPLLPDSTYTNPYGETFTVRNFRYYISRLSFTSANGQVCSFPEKYFLIDERKPESRQFTLSIPFSGINSISFVLGVDSNRNVSGVQTGALDPANGMFWTWSSGYIMAKLEGSSPQAKAPQNSFTYHIGGFRSGEAVLRPVMLPVQRQLKAGTETKISITANVNAWFAGSHPLKIADQPSIMTPGPQAMQVADNYSRMFSIASLQ